MNVPAPARILEWLREPERLQRAHFMIIVAHPDDEVIGIGARLPHLTSSLFVHVTSGATWRCSLEDAATRSAELVGAFDRAGLCCDQLRPLAYPDQSASHRLVGLTSDLAALISAEQPEAIFTHPYEGGHPDHDAIAFAIQAACGQLKHAPPIVEMAFYHRRGDGIHTGDFLPHASARSVTLRLSPNERTRKQELLDCFVSQRETLRYFGTTAERFQIAPQYDFTKPPHRGPLFYEDFDWGISSGAQWRSLARDASAKAKEDALCV